MADVNFSEKLAPAHYHPLPILQGVGYNLFEIFRHGANEGSSFGNFLWSEPRQTPPGAAPHLVRSGKFVGTQVYVDIFQDQGLPWAIEADWRQH